MNKLAIIFALTFATSTALAATLQDNKALVASAIQAVFVDFNDDSARALMTDDYIQHNPNLATGPQALIDVMPLLREANVKTTNIRLIAEGDLVVAHNLYDNAQMIGAEQLAAFDVWRIQDGKLAEHWDNLQPTVSAAQTASGNSMTDGETRITDLHKTTDNKALVLDFVDDVLRNKKLDTINKYLAVEYIQHNPQLANGRDTLRSAMEGLQEKGIELEYGTTHLTVAEGNFVFTATEGSFAGKPTSFYDLFRVHQGMIIEHWDVVSQIPATSANTNGLF